MPLVLGGAAGAHSLIGTALPDLHVPTGDMPHFDGLDPEPAAAGGP
ncbi:hypothetical protein J7E96_36135 [Streptomyces sp. ISL-96]|nr:hypothetical protein [Streptomyces sp. ISL-96]MBT2493833.1 hypothetical protein [Streptomyces sp. ISL-96]